MDLLFAVIAILTILFLALLGTAAYYLHGCVQFYSRYGIWEAVLFHHKTPSLFGRNRTHRLARPHELGYPNIQNVHIVGPAGKIGAWYYNTVEHLCRAYVLYLHGRSGDRSAYGRIKLAQKLVDFGFDVLAIDYRGFGDSEGFPSERGVVEDSTVALSWLFERTRKKGSLLPVILWGHSLGTGVALKVASEPSNQYMISGLVLEAPFYSIHDQLMDTEFYIAKMLCLAQYSINKSMLSFDNAENIKKVDSELLMLHSIDDPIISHTKSECLYAQLSKTAKSRTILVLFKKKYGHCKIYRARCLKVFVDHLMDRIHCRAANAMLLKS